MTLWLAVRWAAGGWKARRTAPGALLLGGPGGCGVAGLAAAALFSFSLSSDRKTKGKEQEKKRGAREI